MTSLVDMLSQSHEFEKELGERISQTMEENITDIRQSLEEVNCYFSIFSLDFVAKRTHTLRTHHLRQALESEHFERITENFRLFLEWAPRHVDIKQRTYLVLVETDQVLRKVKSFMEALGMSRYSS